MPRRREERSRTTAARQQPREFDAVEVKPEDLLDPMYVFDVPDALINTPAAALEWCREHAPESVVSERAARLRAINRERSEATLRKREAADRERRSW